MDKPKTIKLSQHSLVGPLFFFFLTVLMILFICRRHRDMFADVKWVTLVSVALGACTRSWYAKDNYYWHGISNNVVCATSKASDQPAHTHSLIRAFASRLDILLVLSY